MAKKQAGTRLEKQVLGDLDRYAELRGIARAQAIEEAVTLMLYGDDGIGPHAPIVRAVLGMVHQEIAARAEEPGAED